MKKRAMKKWIPKGMYCHGNGTKKNPYCKWLKFIGIKKHNKYNCEFAEDCDICDECKTRIYKCEYMNYIDYDENSLLWDACKECNIKYDY